MKPSIKRVRTCVYSKPAVNPGFFEVEAHKTNKQVCDHPEMKINWTLEICADCKVYVNRNTPPAPAAPPPKKSKGRKPKTAETIQ